MGTYHACLRTYLGDGREARIKWGVDARIKGVGALWTGWKCDALQGKQDLEEGIL